MSARVAAFPDGRPCWTEAVLPDVEAGKRFYGELFGWTFEAPGAEPEPGPESEPGQGQRSGAGPGGGKRNDGYALALVDGRPAAGLLAKRDGRLPTVWNLYFAASDAAARAASVDAAGGTVLTQPEAADGMAVRALAADPGGAVFGLWQAVGLTGFVVRDGPGAYAWSEVHTRGGEAVDAFYAELFGYGTDDEERSGITVWAPKGDPVDDRHAIGGRRVLGEDLPAELPPHFLTYFWVEDCGAAARTTVRLGGRASRGPEEGPYGRYAVLVDNQGARFAVREIQGAAPGSVIPSETVVLTAPITPGEHAEYADGEETGDENGEETGDETGGEHGERAEPRDPGADAGSEDDRDDRDGGGGVAGGRRGE